MADLFADGGGPPQELIANLIYRVLVLAEIARNPAFAANVEELCRRDSLFFFNTFGWVFEPRPRRNAAGEQLPKELPFISWPHQEPMIRTLEEHLGYEDIGVTKSRGEGASWIVVLEATRWWAVKDGTKVNFVSKDENAVDRKNDSDSLMWKVDFAVERLPRCFVGHAKKDYVRNYSDHVLYSIKRGSAIAGFAATADVASGGRADWFGMDELAKFPKPADVDAMASTQYVTDSRLIVSTPKGASGAYYDVMHEPNNMHVIVLDWKENPTRNRGLYVFKHGLPEAIDPVNNPLPPEYNPPSPAVLDRFERLRRRGFKLEGKVRSPWYDHQCDRPKATPESIARELDRDFGGSEKLILNYRFFDAVAETTRDPNYVGRFTFNHEDLGTGKFTPDEIGELSLWMSLDERYQPGKGKYVLGVDIAMGGAEFGSNSVISGINQFTGEQVLEYVTTFLEPKELAAVAAALARWLGGALIGWEENGPGGPFGRALMGEYRHLDVYHEPRTDRTTHKKTSKPGWWKNNNKAWMLFSNLSSSVQDEELIIRSAAMAEEARQYIQDDNGKIIHVTAGSDPTHGDRVISLGIANEARLTKPVPKTKEQKAGPPPVGSIAHRQQVDQAWQELEAEGQWWDDRTTADFHRDDSSNAMARMRAIESEFSY